MKQKLQRWIPSLVLLVLSFGEWIFMQNKPSFFFPWYRQLSKRVMASLSFLFSFMRYSVWDIGAALLVLGFIIALIVCVCRRHGFIKLLRRSVLIISILLFTAMQGWLGNHYAPPLSVYLDLEVTQYSIDQLYEAAEYYLEQASSLSAKMERDGDGHLLAHDFFSIAKTAGSSYQGLREKYPVLEGSAVPVKCFSLIGEYLLYNGIIGMFMPVTGESSVPRNVPPAPMPYTMCHEAAHRLGIASEQEANFCAFLACINSDELCFRYSGAFSAFESCWASLYSADSDQAKALYKAHRRDENTALVFLDMKDTSLAYERYDSPMKEISDNINDTYLKSFSHESGIRSYGEVTDYLIAWYLNR